MSIGTIIKNIGETFKILGIAFDRVAHIWGFNSESTKVLSIKENKPETDTTTTTTNAAAI